MGVMGTGRASLSGLLRRCAPRNDGLVGDAAWGLNEYFIDMQKSVAMELAGVLLHIIIKNID